MLFSPAKNATDFGLIIDFPNKTLGQVAKLNFDWSHYYLRRISRDHWAMLMRYFYKCYKTRWSQINNTPSNFLININLLNCMRKHSLIMVTHIVVKKYPKK